MEINQFYECLNKMKIFGGDLTIDQETKKKSFIVEDFMQKKTTQDNLTQDNPVTSEIDTELNSINENQSTISEKLAYNIWNELLKINGADLTFKRVFSAPISEQISFLYQLLKNIEVWGTYKQSSDESYREDLISTKQRRIETIDNLKEVRETIITLIITPKDSKQSLSDVNK